MRWQVWHVAAMIRSPKLPEFDKFLNAGTPRAQQSTQALQMAAKAMAEYYKGK